jgi:retron-type reverse transcriptase
MLPFDLFLLCQKEFFDHINHDMLMARIARKVKDKRILKLIRLYLQSGVMNLPRSLLQRKMSLKRVPEKSTHLTAQGQES